MAFYPYIYSKKMLFSAFKSAFKIVKVSSQSKIFINHCSQTLTMTIYINNYSINLHWMKIIYKDSVEDTKKDDIILATKRRKLLTSLCHSPSPSNKCSSNQTPTQTSRCALRGTFPIWFPDCLAGLLTSSMSSFSCSVQFSSVQSLSHV